MLFTVKYSDLLVTIAALKVLDFQFPKVLGSVRLTLDNLSLSKKPGKKQVIPNLHYLSLQMSSSASLRDFDRILTK